MVLVLGSLRKAPVKPQFAADIAGTKLGRGLTEAQHCALGVELHLLERGFLVPLFSAFTHQSLQFRKTE